MARILTEYASNSNNSQYRLATTNHILKVRSVPVALFFAHLVIASTAMAAEQQPFIEFIPGEYSVREVKVEASWVDPVTLQESAIEQDIFLESKPWTSTVNLARPGSQSEATQDSGYTTHSIYAQGSAYTLAKTYQIDYGDGPIDKEGQKHGCLRFSSSLFVSIPILGRTFHIRGRTIEL